MSKIQNRRSTAQKVLENVMGTWYWNSYREKSIFFVYTAAMFSFQWREQQAEGAEDEVDVQRKSFRVLLPKQNQATPTTSQKKSHVFYLPSMDLYV